MAKDKGGKNDKTNVMRLLDASGTAYRAHFYDSADGRIDGVSVAGKTGLPVESVFKTLVTVGAGGGLYVFVIPVAQELDLKKAAKAAGEKSIAMIAAKDLLKNTGYIHGGCSPLGMKKPFPTFIHESAGALQTMACSAGKIGAQIELAPNDLLGLCRAQYADLIK